MIRNRNDKKIVGATVLSLGILLSASVLSSWIHAPKHLESDSAFNLAHSSFWNEAAQFKEQAQRLGSYVSTEAQAAQWQQLRSQMQEQGATAKTADDVLARVILLKHPVDGGIRNSSDPLWPLAVNAASVKKREVWVIHLAYWNPQPRGAGWCGTNEEYKQLSHLTYVVDDEAPHRCWVSSITFKFLNPQERKECVLDEDGP